MLELYVIGARPYSFTDEKSGRLVQGVNVFHLTKSEDAIGQIPQKVTLPYESWGAIKNLTFPSVHLAVTEQTFSSKGVVTKVVGIEPIKK